MERSWMRIVGRTIRTLAAKAGLSEKDWTPRELRHSYASSLSSSGVSIEDMLHPVGGGSTNMTGSCDAPA
jgi:site-specific recombinase XerD